MLGCACCANTRDFCSALAAVVGPVQDIFVITVTITFDPITQQAGKVAVLGRLSLSMCLWNELPAVVV